MSKIFLSHPKALLILGIIFLISFGCTKTNKTEMLVMGGTILTIDSSMPEAEAMMIRDGRIEALGSRAELETRFPKARRQDFNGNPPDGWYPDQTLTAEEALYAMTLVGAYAAFQENQLGSLTQGKFADFVELDKDPHHIKPEELKNIKVLRTWVAGKVVSEN